MDASRSHVTDDVGAPVNDDDDDDDDVNNPFHESASSKTSSPATEQRDKFRPSTVRYFC